MSSNGSVKREVIENILGDLGRYQIVESLLERANGDIGAALSLSRRRNQYSRSPGDSLGSFGFSGPGKVSYRVRGSAPSNDVQVWMPGTPITSPPDFEITWYEIFEFVLYDSDLDLPRQLKLC
jgi:hypothetical protein